MNSQSVSKGAARAAIAALACLFATAAPATGAGDGIAMAKRVVAAIRGQAQFRDSDFVHRLAASEKSTLRRFAPCRLDKVFYMLKPDPTERDTYFENSDEVMVIFNCKGVPVDTPAAISLHLKDGRIATVETHNADLVKQQ